MRDKLIVWCAAIMVAIMIPYIITVMSTGVIGTREDRFKDISSGKNVRLEVDGEYVVLDVEEYLIGVLAGQISPYNEEAAIRAQAIIARTNILKEMEEVTVIESADLNEEYLLEEERRELWGEKRYNKCNEIIENAIIDTSGITMVYEGEYIEAVYHNVSCGVTADSMELYGKDVPYLKRVESSCDIESKDYMEIYTFTIEQIATLLSIGTEEFSMEITNSNSDGYVAEVKIGEILYSGDDIMRALNLCSNNFYIEIAEGGYKIICLGSGYGIGLSQYGANYMATQGKTYEEILKYYYSGISLNNTSDK